MRPPGLKSSALDRGANKKREYPAEQRQKDASRICSRPHARNAIQERTAIAKLDAAGKREGRGRIPLREDLHGSGAAWTKRRQLSELETSALQGMGGCRESSSEYAHARPLI